MGVIYKKEVSIETLFDKNFPTFLRDISDNYLSIYSGVTRRINRFFIVLLCFYSLFSSLQHRQKIHFSICFSLQIAECHIRLFIICISSSPRQGSKPFQPLHYEKCNQDLDFLAKCKKGMENNLSNVCILLLIEYKTMN